MVVEDNPSLREILVDVVESEGHQVIYAGSDPAAMWAAMGTGPDLVILDLVMGQLRGEEVYATMRKDPKTVKIPVIICTVHRENSVSRKLGQPLEPQDPLLQVLFKPFTMQHAVQMLRLLLPA